MSDQKYAVVYSTHRGTNYLTGFETFCFGSRMLGYFSLSPSCALPLSYNRACQFRDMLHRDMPARLYHVDPKSNLPAGLQVIPYPGKPEQEVTGDV